MRKVTSLNYQKSQRENLRELRMTPKVTGALQNALQKQSNPLTIHSVGAFSRRNSISPSSQLIAHTTLIICGLVVKLCRIADTYLSVGVHTISSGTQGEKRWSVCRPR